MHDACQIPRLSMTISSRVPIPKRMASRIRTAQAQVVDIRSSIVTHELRLKQDIAEMAQFDANPTLYAKDHYGKHGVESYPVQTRILRLREAIEFREMRLPQKYKELKAAELNLELVEANVFDEVLRMKPTPGRIPWPDKLATFDEFRIQTERRWKIELRASAAEKAKTDVEEAQRWSAWDKKFAEERRKSDEEIDDIMAKLSPEARQEYREYAKRMSSDLKSGRITFAEILGALRARK